MRATSHLAVVKNACRWYQLKMWKSKHNSDHMHLNRNISNNAKYKKATGIKA